MNKGVKNVVLFSIVVGLGLVAAGGVSAGVDIEHIYYLRGDVNDSDTLSLLDASMILDYLFNNGSIDCVAAADVDGSGNVSSADSVYLLSYLYSGGTAPPAPFPDCDGVDDSLECEIECE